MRVYIYFAFIFQDGISDVRIDEVDKKSGTSSHCDMNIFKRTLLLIVLRSIY